MRSRDTTLNDLRRKEILTAAGRCFVQQGFHATSMKDICAAVGMSAGTLYHYYASKAEIIEGIIAEERKMTDGLLTGLAQSQDFIEALFSAFDAIFASITSDDLVLHAEVSAEILRQPALRDATRNAEQTSRAALAGAIARAQAAGEVDHRLDPAWAAVLVSALIDGLLWHATVQGTAGLTALLPAAKQALARMLANPDEAS